MMPLCTLQELMSMKSYISIGEGQFFYDVFGGSARNFGCKTETVIQPVEFVEKDMLWFFGDEYKTMYPTAWNSAKAEISKQFRKSKDKNINVLNSLMMHRDDGMVSIWASKFMEVLASTIYEEKEISMYEEVKKLAGKGGFGNVFELIAHRKLSSCSEDFEMIPLHKKGARNVSREPVSFNFHQPVVQLRSVEDIGKLPQHCYGLPVVSNFPLIDSVVPPAALLQMTVSEENHKGAVNQLENIRAQLPEEDKTKHMMIFVVPQKNITKFKYQENLSSIKQFILCPDKVIDTKKRKNR